MQLCSQIVPIVFKITTDRSRYTVKFDMYDVYREGINSEEHT